MKISIECAPENGKAGRHMEMEGEAFFCTAITPNPGGGVRAVTRALGGRDGRGGGVGAAQHRHADDGACGVR